MGIHVAFFAAMVSALRWWSLVMSWTSAGLTRGSEVLHVSDAGNTLTAIDIRGKPTAVRVAPDGKMLVCDTSERRQVLVYDVSGDRPRVA